MSREYDCDTCRDRGVIAPRWHDDTDRMVPCPQRGCLAAEERAQEEEREAAAPPIPMRQGFYVKAADGLHLRKQLAQTPLRGAQLMAADIVRFDPFQPPAGVDNARRAS